MKNHDAPVAVQVNLFQVDDGILVVPFSHYDEVERTATEICRFVIPWHEWRGITDRIESIEQHKIDRDAGISPI